MSQNLGQILLQPSTANTIKTNALSAVLADLNSLISSADSQQNSIKQLSASVNRIAMEVMGEEMIKGIEKLGQMRFDESVGYKLVKDIVLPKDYKMILVVSEIQVGSDSNDFHGMAQKQDFTCGLFGSSYNECTGVIEADYTSTLIKGTKYRIQYDFSSWEFISSIYEICKSNIYGVY